MANLNIPEEEQNLTPEDVERLDARRRRGQLLLTLCLQTTIVTLLLLLLFVGQDLTYSPGFMRPMAYWALLTGTIAVVSGLSGIRLRRGLNEFTSY